VRAGSFEAYQEFASFLNDQEERLQTIRGLLDFETRRAGANREVEPVEEICKRFSTGSMSLGALSTEAHETLAIAMNRIGGRRGRAKAVSKWHDSEPSGRAQ